MIGVIIGLSLLFIVIGFLVTESNAKYLLSGYNTMSAEQRKKVDLKTYLPFFRNFHLFLGVSLFALGSLLIYFVSENAGGIFLAVYPIVAYIYFIWKSKNYSMGLSLRNNKIGAVVLGIVLVSVLVLLYFGIKEDQLLLKESGIEIPGIYGERISDSEIQRIELVHQLPDITFRTNGVALGSIRKGYFKTKENGVVKLILNEGVGPYIRITKTSGKLIYYSSGETAEEEILKEIRMEEMEN